MTVFVDELKFYPHVTTSGGTRWCHLYSDTSVDELKRFAARLGLKPSWFQAASTVPRCHFDLRPHQRTKAVLLGAVEVNAKQHRRQLQEEGRLSTPSGLPDRKRGVKHG